MLMLRLATVAGILLVASPIAARADEHRSNPCAHDPSRMTTGGIDPVEQSCALAMAGQTIAEQAQQIVLLHAQLAVAKSDLAALSKPKAELAPSAK